MISIVPNWGWTIFIIGMIGVGIYTLGAFIVEMIRRK